MKQKEIYFFTGVAVAMDILTNRGKITLKVLESITNKDLNYDDREIV